MTERRKFGEFKQNRFITVVEVDNSCGIEDLMKQKKYGGFREKDYRKLCSIREELNQLYYENEQLKEEFLKLKHRHSLLHDECLDAECERDSLKKDVESLEKENEQLKADNNRLVNETAKIIAEHQGRVLDLIDEKIDELEKRYKFGQEVYKGCPMHNIRFGINTLKELKKELSE